MKHIFPFFRMDSASGGEGGTGSGDQNKNDNGNQGGGDDAAAKRVKELEAALSSAAKEKDSLSKKVNELNSSIEKMRNDGLKSKEDYKTYSEALEVKLKTAEEKAEKFQQAIVHTNRVSAVKDAAVKLGLRSAALGDIEAMALDDVKVTVGEDRMIRVEGAGDFANRLKTTKPYLFETPKDPNFNGGGGQGGAGSGGGQQVTQEQLAAAYRARLKGPAEMTSYRNLQKQFDEQTRKAKAK